MLKRITNKIIEESNKENIPIIPTAPIYNDNTSVNNYADLLNVAINNKDIYNLAVMGSYGTGKSTIIRNYKKRYNKTKTIDISIGTFLKFETDDDKKKEKTDNKEKSDEKLVGEETEKKDNKEKSDEKLVGEETEKKDNKEKLDEKLVGEETEKNINSYNDYIISQKELNIVDAIEKSILKQIINLKYSEELPKSNFKHLNRKFDKYIHNFSIFFIVIITVLYLLFKNLNIVEEMQFEFFSRNTSYFEKWIILFLVLFPFIYELCLLFYNTFSRSIISKIKF